MQLRLHIAITFRLGQCSILLWAPFRGADGQLINLAPIRTYLSVSAHARVWCWLTESNRRHPAYKAGALPAELNQQSGGTGRIRTFDHSVNGRTHNRCASDPEMKKPRTMARLGVLIGQTQIRQPTLNILLICSLKCKHVVTLFCNFPHAFAIVKRILQRLVQAE